MMAQIPLTWQLTDFFSCLGLGFLYGAVYMVLRVAALKKKPLVLMADFIWAIGCSAFTRSWVLTESHAAQLRLSMVIGVMGGCAIFLFCILPPVRRLVGWLLAVLGVPYRKLQGVLGKTGAKLRKKRSAQRLARQKMREENRAAAEKKRAARREKRQTRHPKKNNQKVEEKELKKQRTIYYNNLQ